ncbi:MAG TPA: Holliday junction branch migration DNA helicase RuvB [Bacilli bacterium]|nr:Holliday junction branch migration DNA helicase RuvB [Bacilli bacterium]HPT89095.1 Holliday junction branch migration DNA helicase RuvB [Bacilli bacterium]HQA20004.1 Holliday junction branch migration DNA helicase RuvB [Bacilli bacterium]HQD92600.1 Holliday junction branch migration DNA helicase RuvB [Bacilli bacterium]
MFQDFLGKDNEELSLRPQTLEQFIGQDSLKEVLNVFIQTAKARQETLDHTLFYGPPGLGKTTLAQIIANEMDASFYSISAPSIDRVGDLASILSNLEPGDVLFIDEIHRLPRMVEEVLYSAMEDYCIDIIVGKDSTASTIKIDLPPFTLIGATTRYGDLSAPLRDRFGIVHHLPYYTVDELVQIIFRTSKVFNFNIDYPSALEIAKRSRGTPRVANRLFRRVRDFSQYHKPGQELIQIEDTKLALDKLNIDNAGLNDIDHKYLRTIIERFGGGPVGVNAIAASIGEEVTTIEDVYEPYLLQEGYIIRTPRGRMVTNKTYEHLQVTKDES